MLIVYELTPASRTVLEAFVLINAAPDDRRRSEECRLDTTQNYGEPDIDSVWTLVLREDMRVACVQCYHFDI